MNLRWIFLAYSALFVFGLSDNIRGPIYPELLTHFQITHAEGSWFFALVSFMSVLSAVLAPSLISKWGHIPVLRLNLALMVASQFIFATANHFLVILMGSVLYGLGVGCLSVVQNVMVLLGSEPKHHQKFQSALHACYGAASLLAPLLVIFFARQFFSWQTSFAFSGFLIFVLFLVSFVPWTGGIDSSEKTLKKTVSPRSFWTLEETYFAAILGIYVGLEVLVGTRLASYMREQMQMDLQSSSLMVMAFFSGLLLGRLLFVVWQPRWNLSQQLITSMTLVVLSMGLSVVVWPPLILVSGFFMAPFYPIMMTGVGRLFPHRMEENMALCNALQGITLVLVHTFVGFISDWAGLKAAMGFGIVLSLVTILMLSLYSRLFKRVFE